MKFPVEYKEAIIRLESDKVKRCEWNRVQKAWIFVRYIHFKKNKCIIMQIYPTIKKWEIPLEVVKKKEE